MSKRVLFLMFFVMALLLCACNEHLEPQTTGAIGTTSASQTNATAPATESTPDLPTDATVPATESTPDLPTDATEPTKNQIGAYTLEECKILKGIFVRYEDGSFDRYNAGGFFNRSGKWNEDEILYINKDKVSSNPVVTPDMQLVLFWDEQIRWNMIYSVLAEGYTIPFYSEEYSRNGAIDLGPGISTGNTATLAYQVVVSGSVYETIYLAKTKDGNIFGTPFKKVEDTKVKGTTFYTFEPGEKVVFNLTEGTNVTVVESYADMAYYVYGQAYADDDYYGKSIDSYLSTDGYIELDFSGHPTGKYVWIIENGEGSYIGTVIQIDNG